MIKHGNNRYKPQNPTVPNRAHTAMSLGNFEPINDIDKSQSDITAEAKLGNFAVSDENEKVRNTKEKENIED